jgi:hypothetical protein
MATKRYRMRFDFQLNVAKEDEHAIAEQIADLKSQGLYSKTVRDGIRLVSDLRDGNLDMLFELFPWVRAEFLAYVASTQPQLSDTEINIQKQLSRIEQLLENGEPPAAEANTTDREGEPKPMQVPSISPDDSDFDDYMPLIVAKATASGKTARNFLDSAFKLVQ